MGVRGSAVLIECYENIEKEMFLMVSLFSFPETKFTSEGKLGKCHASSTRWRRLSVVHQGRLQ